MRCLFLLVFTLVFVASALADGSPPVLEIGLVDSVSGAIQTSGRIGAAEAEERAASHGAHSQASLLFPKLSIDATWRYATEVPTLPILGQAVPFGDNESYSIGPVLSWILWDGGALRKGWHSQEAIVASRAEEKMQAERQITLAVRLAYLGVLQAAEHQRLVADSVRVAQARGLDIEKRKSAGSASEIDLISARREVLALQLQFHKAQSDLAGRLRDLFALSRGTDTADLRRPVDARIVDAEKVSGAAPTMRVLLDSVDRLAASLEVPNFDEAENASFRSHPKIRAMTFQVESLRLAAEGASASNWPKVTLVAKSSLDYPNGPNPESVFQNYLGATFSWSLFEFGRVQHNTAEKRSFADAAEERKRQTETDLNHDWRKALEQVTILKSQRDVHRQSIQQSEKLLDLINQSYIAGRSSFLEVQSAHLAALDARIADRRNEIQILMQSAILREIIGEK